ncbi:hypothetical protein ERO13_D02G140732v2 [Gossypium hirsutum]|nr:hypothetical protein ERO13_D02G140732v2 [Gossypium hirsutum]
MKSLGAFRLVCCASNKIQSQGRRWLELFPCLAVLILLYHHRNTLPSFSEQRQEEAPQEKRWDWIDQQGSSSAQQMMYLSPNFTLGSKLSPFF